MHVDEYRAAFGHRTRTNRLGGRRNDEQPAGDRVVAGGPAGPPCPHLAVRETSIAGRLTDRKCIDCGQALPDREWED